MKENPQGGEHLIRRSVYEGAALAMATALIIAGLTAHEISTLADSYAKEVPPEVLGAVQVPALPDYLKNGYIDMQSPDDSIPPIEMPKAYSFGGDNYKFSKEGTEGYLQSPERDAILTPLFTDIASNILQNVGKIGLFEDFKLSTNEWGNATPDLEGYVQTSHIKLYGGSETQYMLGLNRSSSGEYDLDSLDYLFFSTGSNGNEGTVDDLHTVLVQRDEEGAWNITESYVDDFGTTISITSSAPIEGFTAPGYEIGILLDDSHVLDFIRSITESDGFRIPTGSLDIDRLAKAMPEIKSYTA